jgi:bacterioferritin-associated ferredoxin
MGTIRYTDEQLRDAVRTSTTIREILVKLGVAAYGGNYETVRRRIADLGLETGHIRQVQRGRLLRECTDREIRDAIATSRSLAGVLRKLGVRPGGNQARLRVRIDDAGLDVSHFVGRAWRAGLHVPVVPRTPLVEVLVEGRPARSTSDLRKRLIAEGVKEARCERCSLTSWNDQPIPLELDHANGRRDDNRLENLRLLCPNCHAQTETYRGRNIGIGATYS